MALKWPIPFPFLAPFLNPNPNSNPSQHRPLTEVRFSRWNNANADEFNDRRRAQKEKEDDIRRERRFDSATRISSIEDTATSSTTTSNSDTFKSIGTPSLPSNPSIPGKKSKYSKNPNPELHPAFRRHPKTSMKTSNLPKEKPLINRKANVYVGEDGMSYVIDGAPFEFKYSYTETPKVKPVKLREPPYAPFGPTTMARPWTGRAPLPPSKKKLKEFDSFRLPPPHKKGVKPVQAPGPYLPGSGPKYVMSREEILGEPLTEEEIEDLVSSCIKSKRQLNMGRDGLTHNMLDNIHAHWKRRRVCKIKCKGVCTVDMDNVRKQLEERTGGKIIRSKGGVIYLFRGRNYNYKTRPRFPLMLWKPVTPVYPRLVKQVPEGLTLEEATEMRRKGRELIPICKLGKNGVYIDLVENVREAFEECELVRINCQGMSGSDYHKIGAKLRDLVPCVLISFEREHILMWRGQNWKSSLPKLESDREEGTVSNLDNATSIAPPLEGQVVSASRVPTVLVNNASPEVPDTTVADSTVSDIQSPADDKLEAMKNTCDSASISDDSGCVDDEPANRSNTSGSEITLDGSDCADGLLTQFVGPETTPLAVESTDTKSDSIEAGRIDNEKLHVVLETSRDTSDQARLPARCTEGVLSLLKQAVEGGSAIVVDDSYLDADMIYQKAVAFSKSAPPDPVFRDRPRKVTFKKSLVQNSEKQDSEDLESKEITPLPPKKGREKKGSKIQRRKDDFRERLNNVVPQGSLRVDELAKLLA
ncbi:hypothetical protein FNV43_RR15801 [Rhamnella rubrinervis]|uniref:CRM domain-containing protein n=1 Tax=Rhamnella rubrinervis TaxID=2594499 RepID=A0A8K0E832_9ROSA|nr:hypothetical protein FNV43_RR15801 [Rhamnella rubrinervis]